MRVLFAGTPEAAVPSLTALLASQHRVVAVLTRADAPAGRGKKLTPSPVRVAAEAAGIPALTGKPSESQVQAEIAALNCEAAAVVAYGHLLKQNVLDLLPRGWFNLHFSLLPKWRGAAPVQWALINGDKETGVSVFQLDAGMDTGPVFASLVVPVGHANSVSLPNELSEVETSGTLLPKLAELGAELLVTVLDQVAAGTAVGVPQPAEGTLAPKITVDQARVNWRQIENRISNLVRGVTPNPGAWTTLVTPGLEPVRIGLGPIGYPNEEDWDRLDEAGEWRYQTPGRIYVEKRNVWVGTEGEPIRLGLVQPPGKKPMPATDWARGARLTPESRFE